MKKLFMVAALGAGMFVGQANAIDVTKALGAANAIINLQKTAEALKDSLETAKTNMNKAVANAKDKTKTKLQRGAAAVTAINASLVPLNNLVKLLKSINKDVIKAVSEDTSKKFDPSLAKAEDFMKNITEMANTLDMLLQMSSGGTPESSTPVEETETTLMFD